MNDESMLTAKEAAHFLKLHVNTVKRMGDRGELPFYRVGARGDRRFRRSDIELYLNGRVGDGRSADRA